MKELKDYIRFLKQEIVMAPYQDGWSLEWLENKLKELMQKQSSQTPKNNQNDNEN